MVERLILFDIDGTLLVTKGVGRESTRRAMLEVFGTSSRLDDYWFAGQTDWAVLVELLAKHGFDGRVIAERMARYEESIARHMRDVFEQSTASACPGALDLVQRLARRDDVVLGVVTGNVSSVAPIKLQAAGYDPAWFLVGAYGNEAMSRNDLPRMALDRALGQVETLRPEDVIVVGDTAADVASARALGAVAVAVATGKTPREELAALMPDLLLNDLTGFEAAIFAQG
jgi:phosphoglycolate phosphatase-like HAD superfamily hydrolase